MTAKQEARWGLATILPAPLWAAVALLFLSATAALGGPGQTRTNLTLAWTMPAGNPLVDSFNLYSTTNVSLALTNWTLTVNIPSGYSSTTTNGGSLIFTNDVTWTNAIPWNGQMMFFTITSSNYAGESGFSNQSGAAGQAANVNSRIR